MSNKILIMAGGTGGHIFPALAVARVLHQEGWEIHWLGTLAGLESQIIPNTDFKITLHTIAIRGLRGSRFWTRLWAPFQILRACLQAGCMIYRIKPRVVLGMGGYVTGPGGMAAVGLRCPLIIHEQNAYAGFTNRCLRPFATHALQAFPGVLARAETVGNPVRSEIMALPSPELRYAVRDGQTALRILVLGGSRGALAINRLLPKTLALLPETLRPEIWHQTGADHEIVTQTAYQTVGVSAKIEPFIQDMAEAYAWADLVIARAGALTIFELAAVGMGSILIPYPFAVDDHQSHNAQYLVRRGAAYVLPQTESTPERLMAVLMPFIQDRTKAYQMAACARQAATPEALAILVGYCKNTVS